MGFGDLLSSGNIGTEFAKALTVKVPRSKYGLIEGLAMAQKKRAAAAKAGLSAEDDLNKLRIKAADDLKDVDPKVRNQMQEAYYGFMDKTDNAVLNAPDASAAMPEVTRAYMEFKNRESDISARSNVFKKVRAQAAQPNVLVPPSVTEFFNNQEDDLKDDGLFDLAGWRDRILNNPGQLGWASMTFPKRMVLSRYDQNLLENNDVAYFAANSDGAPTVGTKTIEGKTIQTTRYKLSKDAIRKQVIASATDQDYLANMSYSYYEKNRKDPNFKQKIRELELNNPGRDILYEEAVENRVNELYAVGIYKTDEVSGNKPTTITVNNVSGDDKSKPAFGSPFLSRTKIKQTLQDRSSQFASVFTFGNSISAGEASTLSVVEGTIDANTNEAFSASGSFDFKPSQIVLAPVYARAERANSNYDVQGKLVDTGAINVEFNNDNVVFEIFVQGTSTKEFTNADNITTTGAELFYPAQNFWASNQAAATKAQVSVGEAELKTMAELSSVRDMLNDKDTEAVALFKQSIANDTDQNLQARLVKLAYDKGYVNRYKKGNNFVPPQEMGRKGPGPGIQTKNPAPQTKKDGAKPAANTTSKAAANKTAAPAKSPGLPQGTPRRTAKRESR
jgi:hypothetical protein